MFKCSARLRRYRGIGIIAASIALSATSTADEELPDFVVKLIELYKTAPPRNSPGSIWKYSYKHATVYYVPRLACCDIPSTLYDVNGRTLCSPDGGISGGGDGKCPDFFSQRSNGVRLWGNVSTDDAR